MRSIHLLIPALMLLSLPGDRPRDYPDRPIKMIVLPAAVRSMSPRGSRRIEDGRQYGPADQ